MQFGERLKLYRELAKYSQAGLARQMGWGDAQSRISQYETGEREPTLLDIERFAKLLGISPQVLAFGDIQKIKPRPRKPKPKPSVSKKS
jgi:transcriptional regulator with XRE-family HTH domain